MPCFLSGFGEKIMHPVQMQKISYSGDVVFTLIYFCFSYELMWLFTLDTTKHCGCYNSFFKRMCFLDMKNKLQLHVLKDPASP